MTEPLSEERLSVIRQHLEQVRAAVRSVLEPPPSIIDLRNPEPEIESVPISTVLMAIDALELLRAVERLRGIDMLAHSADVHARVDSIADADLRQALAFCLSLHEMNTRKAREEIARLRAENTAMREIIERVATCDNSDGVACYQLCAIRVLPYRGADDKWYEHTEPCVVDRARALVAEYDTGKSEDLP